MTDIMETKNLTLEEIAALFDAPKVDAEAPRYTPVPMPVSEKE